MLFLLHRIYFSFDDEEKIEVEKYLKSKNDIGIMKPEKRRIKQRRKSKMFESIETVRERERERANI